MWIRGETLARAAAQRCIWQQRVGMYCQSRRPQEVRDRLVTSRENVSLQLQNKEDLGSPTGAAEFEKGG